MGIFKRFKSVINGFFESFTSRAEEKNPEFLIADAESRIGKCKKEAQKQLVEVQTWAETVKIDMREAEKKLHDVKRKIQLAVKEKNRELLIELVMQEEESEKLYEERKSLYDAAVAEALRIRDNYKQFENDMNTKLHDLQTMRSQSKLLVIREQIQKIDSDYTSSVSSGIQEKMDRLQKSLNTRCAGIIANEQLSLEYGNNKLYQLEYAASKKRAALQADTILRLESE